MKKRIITLLCLALGACASITKGTTQSVAIDTPLMSGAACKLTDTKNASWLVPSSPGSVIVQKGDGPMNIVCEKDGYETTAITVNEQMEGAVIGNILVGGIIGVVIDASNGAAQKYPDSISVWMKPKIWQTADDAIAWNIAKQAYDASGVATKDGISPATVPTTAVAMPAPSTAPAPVQTAMAAPPIQVPPTAPVLAVPAPSASQVQTVMGPPPVQIPPPAPTTPPGMVTMQVLTTNGPVTIMLPANQMLPAPAPATATPTTPATPPAPVQTAMASPPVQAPPPAPTTAPAMVPMQIMTATGPATIMLPANQPLPAPGKPIYTKETVPPSGSYLGPDGKWVNVVNDRNVWPKNPDIKPWFWQRSTAANGT